MAFFQARVRPIWRYFWLAAIFVCVFSGLIIAHHFALLNWDKPIDFHLLSLGVGAALMGLLVLLWLSIRKFGRKLASSEELFRAVFKNAAVGLIHTDRQGQMLHANESFCRMLGYSHEEVLSPNFRLGEIFYSETARAKLFGENVAARIGENRCVLNEPCRGKHDRLVWVELYVELILEGENAHTYVIATVDVTRQRRVAGELAAYRENLEKLVDERTAELRGSEERFRFIAEHNHDVIWTLDIKSQKLTYVSPAVKGLRGITPEEAMAQSPWEAFPPQSRPYIQQMLDDALRNWEKNGHREEYRNIETRQVHRDGHEIDVELVVSIHPDENGRPGSLLGVTHDITERKRVEEDLRRMAFYDGLTQLPNRRLMYDRLRQAIRHARRKQRRIALLFIDLDNFKPVNDSRGHQTGDLILAEVAKRMQGTLRAYDTAARMGGDEFIILLPELDNVSDAMAIAERVRFEVARPFDIGDEPIELSTSIGIALFPDHADNEHELMRMGDDAMYQAKRSGRNRVEMLSFPTVDTGNLSWSPLDDVGAPLILSWSSVFECGDPQIDAEHQNLFDLANHVIRTAMERDAQPEKISSALDALLTEIAEHFVHEEEALEKQHWPHLSAHADKHRELLNRASALRGAADNDNLPLGELVDFLAVEVVVQHILTDDRQYYSCFQRN